MACPVCTHALVAEIDANPAHLSLRQLEQRFNVSRSALQRHQQRCRQPSQLPWRTPGEPVAPACIVNAAVHQALVQLASTLPTSQAYLNDPRRAVSAVVALLLQVVTDDTGA